MMNALYVTVSIPLLLVLAGFNHAHGLTTFGKSNNQGTQQPQRPAATPKHCTTQANCSIIKGTTCIKDRCLCGNNENPINGKCTALKAGANHLCTSDGDCVDDAHCSTPPANKSKSMFGPNDKVCVCDEGHVETERGTCGGESNFFVLPGLIMIATSLSRILY
ncbi:uncharacterized protein sosie isoform X1 [Tribolium castaneum]|nr:PREDICTED: uncharacterized protein LOC103313006 isoform X1 [Tribolium castaneum]|eukprot:XP_008193341.1 PREDICTED: uncharacterized protein LOC103313006 isoform X1 [Tribolium castaneum]